jgi:hypothetical protein
MSQMDDSIGAPLQHIEDIGETDNTIVIFITDNGAEVFTWPDGGMTPFKATKGTSFEGDFRVPAIIRWPGHIKPGSVENGIFSGLDWFPTLVAAAGNPNITDQLLKGVKLGDRTYKNHLDGYNQMALLTGTGPSARHELFYFSGPQLGALRIDDFKFQFLQQPWGWPGEKVTTDMPSIVNLRWDPFERTPNLRGESLNQGSLLYGSDFYTREFWRFVLVQQVVGKLALTAIDYPPPAKILFCSSQVRMCGWRRYLSSSKSSTSANGFLAIKRCLVANVNIRRNTERFLFTVAGLTPAANLLCSLRVARWHFSRSPLQPSVVWFRPLSL